MATNKYHYFRFISQSNRWPKRKYDPQLLDMNFQCIFGIVLRGNDVVISQINICIHLKRNL